MLKSWLLRKLLSFLSKDGMEVTPVEKGIEIRLEGEIYLLQILWVGQII